jgi:hypothetical protein
MPRLNRLSLGPPASPPPLARQESISPVQQLDPPTSEVESPEPSRSSPSLSPPTQRPRQNSQVPEERPENPDTGPAESGDVPPDDDINTLDDEGWRRIAAAGGIQELLKLGEGVSGAVYKCRLRKSGQVFAMKVL